MGSGRRHEPRAPSGHRDAVVSVGWQSCHLTTRIAPRRCLATRVSYKDSTTGPSHAPVRGSVVALPYHPQHPDVEGHEAHHLVGQARAGPQGLSCRQGGCRDTACRVIHGVDPFAGGWTRRGRSLGDEEPTGTSLRLVEEQVVQKQLRPVGTQPDLSGRLLQAAP